MAGVRDLKLGDGSVDAESFNALIDYIATLGGGGVATDTIWDTKGDIAAATGADAAVKLPLGTNGQVLTVDTTTATGLKYAAAAAGGPTYTAFTPVLSAQTTPPQLGTGGTAAARWAGASGTMVHYYGKIQFGTSGIVVGSGNYMISLPINARITGTLGNTTGRVVLNDQSSGFQAIVEDFDFWDQATIRLRYRTSFSAAPLSFVTEAAPWAWAINDSLWFHIFYEAA